MEYKDKKTHKFWKITYYGFLKAYNTSYGKVGTKGKEGRKSFESKKECYKAGDKLVAQKIKKGYKKINR